MHKARSEREKLGAAAAAGGSTGAGSAAAADGAAGEGGAAGAEAGGSGGGAGPDGSRPPSDGGKDKDKEGSQGGQGPEDMSPPYVIMEHFPLAVFTNGVLTALNELRQCAMLSLGKPAAGWVG